MNLQQPIDDPLVNSPSRRALEIAPRVETIILHEGFSRLSVSLLAQRLSCSKRTLYELAPSKSALVLKILGEFFARIRRDATLAVNAKHDPELRLHDYLRVGVRAAERLSADTVNDIHRWQPAHALWQEHIRRRVQGLCELIDEGIRVQKFREIKSELVAELVFASLNRLREPDFYAITNMPVSEAFQEYYRMLLAALTRETQ